MTVLQATLPPATSCDTEHTNKQDPEISQISAWTKRDGWIAHRAVVYLKDECREREGDVRGVEEVRETIDR